MKWRFWKRDPEPEPEPTRDSLNPEFSFDELLTSQPDADPDLPDYLKPTAPSGAPVDESDSFDMNELFQSPTAPLSEASDERDPDWIASDEENPDKVGDLNMGSLYTRANPHELRRRREAREAQQSFLSRAKRGEIGLDDVPGRNVVSGAFFGLMSKILSPFESIFQSKGVILLAIGTALLFAFMAFSMIEFASWQFGDL